MYVLASLVRCNGHRGSTAYKGLLDDARGAKVFYWPSGIYGLLTYTVLQYGAPKVCGSLPRASKCKWLHRGLGVAA